MARRFLIADDFSLAATAAADLALDDIASHGGGTLHLVHVSSVPIPATTAPDMQAETYVMLEQSILQEAKQRLGERVKELRGRWKKVANVAPAIEITTEVRVGSAAEEILACARVTNADRIYLGSHGRRGLAHAFLGSVAEKVARLSTSPVTIAKAPAPSPSTGIAPAPVDVEKNGGAR